MLKFIRHLERTIINRFGRICGCTAKSTKKSYQSESGENEDFSNEQLQNNHETIEETSFKEIKEFRHGEYEKVAVSLIEDSEEGNPSQEKHQCDDETSSEVTPEIGNEELEERSSSWTKF
ncbi:hypothetical protein JTE90_029526 [Oedothorax gibbosus]|uniref:Uncharacterized protein n=1 Tax=Oedothorax gibbosus TaxID=931172 RepID=A0AAV6VBD7_9ARAC|nr:hypothetical protein JTE90_029526 [Oedothorax gibbosus]